MLTISSAADFYLRRVALTFPLGLNTGAGLRNSLETERVALNTHYVIVHGVLRKFTAHKEVKPLP